MLVEIHQAAGPWKLLVKSSDGSFVKVGSAGTSEAASGQSPSALDAYPPNSAGILFVSLTELVASSSDRFFFNQFLPSLAKYLATPEGQRTMVQFPAAMSPLAKDVIRERTKGTEAFMGGGLMLLSHVASYDDLRAAFSDSDRETRRSAVKAAGSIPGAKATKLLISALTNDDEVVRTEAQRQIVRRGIAARAALQAALPPGAASDEHVLAALHRIEYDEAVRVNTAAGYAEFLSRYPVCKFTDEIRYRYLNAKGDAAALKKLADTFPGGGQGELLDLLEQHAVDLEIRGNTYVQFLPNYLPGTQYASYAPQMRLEMHRLVAYPLKVRIPVGTYFSNKSAPSQETLVTTEKSVVLVDELTTVDMPAVYLQTFFYSYVDGDHKTFTIERSPPGPDLQLLISALKTQSVTDPVAQAAVWMVGGASYDEITSVRQNPLGPGPSFSMIGGADIIAAQRICEAAGIRLPKR
jgi:hypothetical protein